MPQTNPTDLGTTIIRALRKHGHIEIVVPSEERARAFARALTFPGEEVVVVGRARVNGQTRWMVEVRTREYHETLAAVPRRRNPPKTWVQEAAAAAAYQP